MRDDGELKWEQPLETPVRFLPVATENETVIVACDNGNGSLSCTGRW